MPQSLGLWTRDLVMSKKLERCETLTLTGLWFLLQEQDGRGDIRLDDLKHWTGSLATAKRGLMGVEARGLMTRERRRRGVWVEMRPCSLFDRANSDSSCATTTNPDS